MPTKCKISAWGCVYHACMSDHCQYRHMKELQHLYSRNCKDKKNQKNERII
jgi:hypothetical protein